MKNCWMQFFIGIYPLSIEIHKAKITSVVANDYSIWIEHGDYFKDEILSKYFCYICIA